MPSNAKTNYRRPLKISKHRREYDNRLYELRALYLEATNNIKLAGQVIKSATKEEIRKHFILSELQTVNGLIKELNPFLRETTETLTALGNKLDNPPSYLHKDDHAMLEFIGWCGEINKELIIITTALTENAIGKLPAFYVILDDVTKRIDSQPPTEEMVK